MTRARQGDKEAFDQVNTLINEKMHPGTSAGRVGGGLKDGRGSVGGVPVSGAFGRYE